MQATRETLLLLLELQKIDSQIDRLEARRRNLTEQQALEEIEASLSEIERQAGEQQAVHDEAATRQKKIDGDVQHMEAKIKAEEEKLFGGSISSPRELAGLQAEVESLRRRKTSMEDGELVVMEEVEGAAKILADLLESTRTIERQVETARQERDKAAMEVDAQLGEARHSREQWAAKFEGDLLAFYNDLRAKRGGVAIAGLQSGTCLGCHMQLPAQEVERVRATEGIAYCDECRRVLVPLT